jgi:hypothetical protein
MKLIAAVIMLIAFMIMVAVALFMMSNPIYYVKTEEDNEPGTEPTIPTPSEPDKLPPGEQPRERIEITGRVVERRYYDTGMPNVRE